MAEINKEAASAIAEVAASAIATVARSFKEQGSQNVLEAKATFETLLGMYVNGVKRYRTMCGDEPDTVKYFEKRLALAKASGAHVVSVEDAAVVAEAAAESRKQMVDELERDAAQAAKMYLVTLSVWAEAISNLERWQELYSQEGF